MPVTRRSVLSTLARTAAVAIYPRLALSQSDPSLDGHDPLRPTFHYLPATAPATPIASTAVPPSSPPGHPFPSRQPQIGLSAVLLSPKHLDIGAQTHPPTTPTSAAIPQKPSRTHTFPLLSSRSAAEGSASLPKSPVAQTPPTAAIPQKVQPRPPSIVIPQRSPEPPAGALACGGES